MELTQELAKKLFYYHEDGYLIWKENPFKKGRIIVGNRAGYLSIKEKDSRYLVGIYNKVYRVSRIIFLWHNDYLPEFIDHKNRNSLDDKIDNLRPATRAQNNRNVSSSKNSSSKYLGVSWNKAMSKWTAEITINTKTKHLGKFIIESDAAKAYNKEALEHFGEFANLNII